MKPDKITYLNYPPGTFICRSKGEDIWVALVGRGSAATQVFPNRDLDYKFSVGECLLKHPGIVVSSTKPGDTNYDAWWAWWVAVQLGAKQEPPV